MDNNENKAVEENTDSAAVEATTAKKPAAKASKPGKPAGKKPSFGAKIAKVWREFRAEFKKIVWSSKRNTFNNTVLVVVSMIVVAVCIGVLDYAFAELLDYLGGLI